MKWEKHVDQCIREANKGLFLLYHLKKSGAPLSVLCAFYEQSIRAGLEFSCPAFHDALTAQDTARIELIRKRASRCMGTDYHVGPTLAERRDRMVLNQFRRMRKRGASIIPPTRRARRRGEHITPPFALRSRYHLSFLPAAGARFNEYEKAVAAGPVTMAHNTKRFHSFRRI
jgi:hypothetical protein